MDIGFYVTPLVGFSWGEPYGKNIRFGWFRWLLSIKLQIKISPKFSESPWEI
jgi:hypothetical protein